MCTAAINLTSKALNEVTNAEVLLKIKGFISLFIQTMEVSWLLDVTPFPNLTFIGLVVFRFYIGHLFVEAL
jgi:exocyst complex component 6